MQKKLAKVKTKLTKSSEQDKSPAIPRLVAQWTALSEAERNDIETKVIAALKTEGVHGATTWWNGPGELPHWQLIIQSPWCDAHSRIHAWKVRDQAMATALVEAPSNGIILKGHKKEWR